MLFEIWISFFPQDFANKKILLPSNIFHGLMVNWCTRNQLQINHKCPLPTRVFFGQFVRQINFHYLKDLQAKSKVISSYLKNKIKVISNQHWKFLVFFVIMMKGIQSHLLLTIKSFATHCGHPFCHDLRKSQELLHWPLIASQHHLWHATPLVALSTAFTNLGAWQGSLNRGQVVWRL